MDKIINELKSFESKVKAELKCAEVEGYKEGFATGFKKAFELANINVDASNIEWNSIKIFAKWCYINGIDFSYMSKATDTIPFTERVINKFKKSIE